MASTFYAVGLAVVFVLVLEVVVVVVVHGVIVVVVSFAHAVVAGVSVSPKNLSLRYMCSDLRCKVFLGSTGRGENLVI